jgi:hypothetical protein
VRLLALRLHAPARFGVSRRLDDARHGQADSGEIGDRVGKRNGRHAGNRDLRAGPGKISRRLLPDDIPLFIEHEHLVAGQPSPNGVAAVGAVPHGDSLDRLVTAQIDFPPRVGLAGGMRRRFGFEKMPVRVAVDRQIRRAIKSHARLCCRALQSHILGTYKRLNFGQRNQLLLARQFDSQKATHRGVRRLGGVLNGRFESRQPEIAAGRPPGSGVRECGIGNRL